jgi:hypothetical protein
MRDSKWDIRRIITYAEGACGCHCEGVEWLVKVGEAESWELRLRKLFGVEADFPKSETWVIGRELGPCFFATTMGTTVRTTVGTTYLEPGKARGMASD